MRAGFHVVLSVGVAMLASGAQAEELLLGSVRLRGGFDPNPTLLPGGKSSAFTGLDGAFAAGREQDGRKVGLVGEYERTDYFSSGLVPTDRAKLSLEAENTALENWNLRSSTLIQRTSSATLRSSDLSERVRVQWTGGAVRPFISGEVRFSSLNETNAILTTFLPEDLHYGRATVIPGVAIKLGDVEFGTSVNLSATRYLRSEDMFGFRRDNERIEPFLFYRYEGKGLTFAAAVSQLNGIWHDPDFSRVKQTMYDVSLTKKLDAFTLDLAAKKFAGETTFPISPITITTMQSAKLSWSPREEWTLAAFVKNFHTAYLDSPFSTDIRAYGVTASYALAKDWLIGAEIARINSIALNGEPVDGGSVTLSLTKKFDGLPAKSDKPT